MLILATQLSKDDNIGMGMIQKYLKEADVKKCIEVHKKLLLRQ